MEAKRVFVSVSTKSAYWSQINESANVAIDVAMGLIRQKEDMAQPVEPNLLVVEKWGSRTHIVFDLYHDTYDADNAHLPDQGDLPVTAVWLSSREVLDLATEGIRNKVNEEVRDIHRKFGDGSRPPFFIDHSNGKVPVFVNPRKINES